MGNGGSYGMLGPNRRSRCTLEDCRQARLTTLSQVMELLLELIAVALKLTALENKLINVYPTDKTSGLGKVQESTGLWVARDGVCERGEVLEKIQDLNEKIRSAGETDQTDLVWACRLLWEEGYALHRRK